MGRSATAASAAVLALALAPAAPALADQVIEAQTVWRFDAMSYTIDQGELLTFRNVDAASPGDHNVTAQDEGPDGKPIFASATVPHGQEVPVEGARQLRTGSYQFICTIHSFMEATLVVTDKGMPLPAAGGPPPAPSQPPPSPPPPSQPDSRAPDVRAALAPTSLRKVLRTRRVRATVTADEAVSLVLRLTARIGSRTVRLGTAEASYGTAGRPLGISVRVARSRLKALRRARRAQLTLAVEARDSAGNLTPATARRSAAR